MGLGEELNVASHAVEDTNAGRLDGVLTGVNWNDEQKLGSPANREGLIRQLLNHFAGLDLSGANLSDGQVDAGNVLGDAYEYLIYQFADDAGKKGGEFYTPREVVRLCDPTAGSCGMLIYAAQYVQEQGGDICNLVLHGQERNLGTPAIGKLNLLLHGLRAARLEPNLFFGASISIAICVLNRDKPAARRGSVLFADAAQPGYYRAERAQNFLDREHFAGIVAAYQDFEDVERFAHVADLVEIEGNDYNINISRCVDTTEPVETLSVAEALAQLREAERRRDEATARMDALLAELGYGR